MESHRERKVLSETLSEKLAKRPFLLIVLTASLSFGVQLIPFQTVSNFLLQSLKALPHLSTYQFKVLSLKESSQSLLTPPVLLAFVCFAILFIVYTSQQEKGESKFEDQNQSVFEPKRGLLYRTATLGQSIVTHFLSHAEDEHILASGDAIPSFDHDTTLHKQRNSEDFVSEVDKAVTTKAEKISVKSAAKEKPKPFAKTSGTNKKLSRPATSTALASKDRSIRDPKLTYLPKSFREDPLQIHKDELNGRFEEYLGNFRRQLQLQRQESLMANAKQLDLKLKNLNRDSKQSNEPLPIASSLSLNDASSEESTKEKKFSKPEVNMDLTEAELNERIDAFLSGFENSSGQEMSETPTPQHRKWHSNSYSSQRFVDSATIEPSAPDSKHSSSQIIRGDSLAIDNQKFDSFLQKFRNELKLQKQKSNLSHQLHRAHEI